MLLMIALILLVLWMVGFLWIHIMGAVIHIFLILAVIAAGWHIARRIRRT